MKNRLLRFARNDLLIPFLLLLLSSCGYSVARLLPANYRTVYIEPFVNEIPFTEEVSERSGFQAILPKLEEDVTRGVINRFLFDGNLRVTTKAEAADLRLAGVIRDFYRQPVRRKDDETVEEYRLNLVASVVCRDREGKILFDESNLIGDATYFVTGSSAVPESAAVDDLIVDFSRRVVERVIENW